jgi:glutamate synthase (NADPH/NADH) large chain
MGQQPLQFHPGKVGLYDFANEHDACGVGFVANINGSKSHAIIEQGIQVLVKLQHRGAIGGDGATGDGAGILFQIPDEFFQAEAPKFKIELPKAGDYGVGMVFLPNDKKLMNICIDAIVEGIRREGLQQLGWRDVPVDPSCLGRQAAESRPHIMQVFIGKGSSELDSDAFERKLYLARRNAERLVG